MKVGLRLFLAAIVMILMSIPAYAQVAIQEVRLGVHADKTRIVVDVSASPEYKVFTLANPPRVVVDIKRGVWQGAETSALARGWVTAVRHARHDEETHRLVIDVKQPVAIDKHFILPANAAQQLPVRLVVDVKPAGGEAAPSAGVVPKPMPAPARGENPAPRPTSKPMIVIDAGHGGKDPGAIGPTGVREKDLTLMAARELRQALLATGQYRVHLTRDSDIFIQLNERIRIAKRVGGALFISLHADAHPNRNAIGASVYTLSQQASDRDAAALAARENKADVFGGAIEGESEEVSRILIELVQRETMNFSAQYATYLVNNLKTRIELKQDTHRFAGFAVLRSPDIPSVLIEMGYVSNPKEEWLMKQASHRKKIIDGIVNGTQQYFAWKQSLE